MSLQESDIDKIAELARLGIDPADKPSYATELNRILALVEQMNGVNTDDIMPMAHPMEAVQRLRADEVTETDQRDHFQSIAPSVEDGLFLVPKVIE